MKLRIDHLLAFVVMVISQSCSTHSDPPMHINDTEPHAYYFVLPDQQQRNLLKGVDEIRLQESSAEVMEKLGKPTDDSYVDSKQGKPIGHVLTYKLKQYDKNLVNEKYDSYVELFFDTNDKLRTISKHFR